MERQKQMIQLSKHVQKKLERRNSPPSDDECSPVDETSPIESYLSSKRATTNANRSYLTENYEKQQHRCSNCSRREKKFQIENERLRRLSLENEKLIDELRSSMSLLRLYHDENLRLKCYLKKIETNLNEYQTNFDQLKKEILQEKKSTPKIFVDDDADEDQRRFEHLKRLRYEIEMYNRLTAAKEKQRRNEEDEIRRKPVEFQF